MLAAYVTWAIVETARERRRQRALATFRPPLTESEFCDRLAAAGVEKLLAVFLWQQLKPYYFSPLTPYPFDRIYGDMKIDPDEINDLAMRFEERFKVWLGETPIDCPADPTIAELGLALQRAR